MGKERTKVKKMINIILSKIVCISFEDIWTDVHAPGCVKECIYEDAHRVWRAARMGEGGAEHAARFCSNINL